MSEVIAAQELPVCLVVTGDDLSEQRQAVCILPQDDFCFSLVQ